MTAVPNVIKLIVSRSVALRPWRSHKRRERGADRPDCEGNRESSKDREQCVTSSEAGKNSFAIMTAKKP